MKGFDPDALLRLRTSAGLTQDDLAKMARSHGARVSGPNICQYEQRRRSPQNATLLALAASLNVAPAVLLIVAGTDELARFRVLAGLTQRLLSLKLGVPQARWSRVEHGRAVLEDSKHSLAADLLQVTVEQLRRALDAARSRHLLARRSAR